MKTETLIGLFVQGTIHNGAVFLGLVESADNDFLYLKYKDSKKIVRISEIAEMKVEPFDDKFNDGWRKL
jgi:hypothetical protein